MAIPDYQKIMLPYLKQTSDGQEHHVRSIINRLAKEFQLTEEDLNTFQPSNGTIRVFDNRCHWAKKYLLEAGLIDSTKKAHVKITADGKDLISKNPPELKIKDLKKYPKFLEFIKPTSHAAPESPLASESEHPIALNPEEQIEHAASQLRLILIQEIHSKLRDSTPDFFEELVIDLLIRMGYGGSRAEAGAKTKRVGDEGIDGTIYEDRLGLDIIYIQAKKWAEDNTVGRPEIQKFVGALHGQKAKKGIFLTTSRFSKEAHEYADSIDPKIVLIDGKRLAELMIDFEVGVSAHKTHVLKRLDSDYFDEEG